MPSTLLTHFVSYTTISCFTNQTTKTNSNNNNRNTLNNAKPTHSIAVATKKTEHTVLTDTNVDFSNINVPTAPWMRGPLQVQSHELLNLSTSKRRSGRSVVKKPDKSLNGKESGVRGKKAMLKIVKSVQKLKVNENSLTTQESKGFDVGESFELGGNGDVGSGDDGLKGFDFGESLKLGGRGVVSSVGNGFKGFDFGESLKLGGNGEVGSGDNGGGGGHKKLPWVREDRVVFWRMKKERVITKAELTLDEVLLGRLRLEASKMRKWVKVKKAGVTDSVVEEIRLTWRRNELAMLKFDLPLCRNMDRAGELVEMKTGGLVVWTRKDTHVVYRGQKYSMRKYNVTVANEKIRTDNKGDLSIQSINGSLFERETDRLLDGLGPRFVDWWMRKPLPVDADLLPEVVPGFVPPSRVCPPDCRSKLSDDEMTYLRKIACAFPTHFALGRNRRLQGLAVAIIKLWEKSRIAKIAVKWGIPNTDNEQMAEELKLLTGGVLILRNKFFIILYRGKDFLPCQIADLVAKREAKLNRCHINEEASRSKATQTNQMTDKLSVNTTKLGTLYEFQDIQMRFGDLIGQKTESELQLKVKREKLERELRNQEHKLSILMRRIEKPARELAKLNSAWIHTELDADQEMISEEERECFRKIGLKMHSSLVLGRRGVFDGVMEGLHQHWKHREVVKVITMQKVFSRVIYTAKMLESESRGTLVSVDKLKEGHAIIIYRGKNYRRPPKLPTDNLLTRRQALCRSLLVQKVGSLNFFAHQRRCAIAEIESKLAELTKSKEKQNNAGALY